MKQYKGYLLGMDLWDMDKLAQGWVFCFFAINPPRVGGISPLIDLRLGCSLRLASIYNVFRENLGQSIEQPTPGDRKMDTPLEVIQMKMEKDHDEMGDSTGAQTADQTSNLDIALEILLQNATEEFGFVPRDVYSGVFDLPNSRAEHDAALGRPFVFVFPYRVLSDDRTHNRTRFYHSPSPMLCDK